MKRIIAILLCVLAFTAVFTACSSSEYTDEQLLEIFKAKYKEAFKLNEYIWGDGLPVSEYDPEEINTEAYYVQVADTAEYATKAELLAAIKSVYVEDYVNGAIDQLLFTGYGEDGPESRYGEMNGKLSVNVLAKGLSNVGEGKFLPDTAKVKRARGNTAVFTVIYQKADGTTMDDELMMLLEDGEWKFKGPTY